MHGSTHREQSGAISKVSAEHEESLLCCWPRSSQETNVRCAVVHLFAHFSGEGDERRVARTREHGRAVVGTQFMPSRSGVHGRGACADNPLTGEIHSTGKNAAASTENSTSMDPTTPYPPNWLTWKAIVVGCASLLRIFRMPTEIPGPPETRVTRPHVESNRHSVGRVLGVCGRRLARFPSNLRFTAQG